MNNQFCHYIINPLKDKRQGGYYSVLLYLIRECFSYQKKNQKTTCNRSNNSDFFNLTEEYEMKQSLNKWTDL